MRPVGAITRGTTSPNRLRRVDSFIAYRCGALLQEAAAPLVVDLGYGATPVTAVPTRLEFGEKLTVLGSFAETRPCAIETERLWEYASEEGNPGNAKHVTGIHETVPSPRLRSGGRCG